MKIRRLSELALLTTVALTIFMIERQIPNPVPIPGVKMGLSNIVTVYAVYHYRPGEVWEMLLSRIILGAFFSGSLLSMGYSLAGGMFCLSGMLVQRCVINGE